MSTVPTSRSSVTPSGICTKGAPRIRVGGAPALLPSRSFRPSCCAQGRQLSRMRGDGAVCQLYADLLCLVRRCPAHHPRGSSAV